MYLMCFQRTWCIPSSQNTLVLPIQQVRLGSIYTLDVLKALIGQLLVLVMYIGAVPKTPQNSAYVAKQAQTFLAGQNPPDFAKLKEGTTFVGLGADVDVKGPIGRVAMGLSIPVA